MDRIKRIANKHPFLFCATVITVAIAIGGSFAQNVDYGSVVSNIVVLWICIGVGYAIIYH